jgi:hypothetical protein
VDYALKGILLSALVFPGLGHLALKRTRRGFVLVLVVLAALTLIVMAALRQARVILANIEQAGGMVDLGTVSQAASQASTAADGWVPGAAALVLVGCWLFGVLDAWRIGRTMDLQKRSASAAAAGKENQ